MIENVDTPIADAAGAVAKFGTRACLMRVLMVRGLAVPPEPCAHLLPDGWIDLTDCPPVYVAYYDVDAHGGLGEVGYTTDRDEAQVFPGAMGVMLAWRTQSTKRPLRNDGQPNRPLTAMTVQPELK